MRRGLEEFIEQTGVDELIVVACCLPPSSPSLWSAPPWQVNRVYLRDPAENGVELYWDRPREAWPRTPAGELAMLTRRLDLTSLLAQTAGGGGHSGSGNGARRPVR